MRKSNLEGVGAVIAMIGGFLGLTIFAPVLTFIFAYIGGMVLDWAVGAKLVNGLNLMFNTTRFTRELIPLTCATLATIGRYLKPLPTRNDN